VTAQRSQVRRAIAGKLETHPARRCNAQLCFVRALASFNRIMVEGAHACYLYPQESTVITRIHPGSRQLNSVTRDTAFVTEEEGGHCAPILGFGHEFTAGRRSKCHGSTNHPSRREPNCLAVPDLRLIPKRTLPSAIHG
jgi:hypothetical protein